MIYYIVKEETGAFGLPGRFKTKDEARDAIKNANRREVKNSFKVTNYSIFRVEHCIERNDNGILLGESTIVSYTS